MADDQALDHPEVDPVPDEASGAEPAAAGGAPQGSDAPAAPAETPSGASPVPPDHEDLAQDDVAKLLQEATPAKQEADDPPKRAEGAVAETDGGSLAEQDVDYLLKQAEHALQSIGGQTAGELPPGAQAYRLEEFRGAPPSTENATLDLIRDVELDLKIELGRTHMYLEEVLKLRKGSVVSLDKLAGDPVDVYVNGRLIARGEVLVLNDNFCVRVAELIAGNNVAS